MGAGWEQPERKQEPRGTRGPWKAVSPAPAYPCSPPFPRIVWGWSHEPPGFMDLETLIPMGQDPVAEDTLTTCWVRVSLSRSVFPKQGGYF